MWKSHSSRVYQQRRFWVRFRPVCRSGFALTPTWTIENWIFFFTGKFEILNLQLKEYYVLSCSLLVEKMGPTAFVLLWTNHIR